MKGDEYVSGETLYVWGKRYYLEVCLGSKNSLEHFASIQEIPSGVYLTGFHSNFPTVFSPSILCILILYKKQYFLQLI
ncbi:MAG: hypothetical protein ACTTJ4_08360 [Treponema sp.]|uniref:hypothetical protein n=1 Tax=Treponema sp. TaxID=166 RepID=UPI003FA1B984